MFFQSVSKKTFELLDDLYLASKSSLVGFAINRLDTQLVSSRLSKATVTHQSLGDKEFWVIDGLFNENENVELRQYLNKASFSLKSYGSQQAIDQGEEPSYTMSGKERTLFLSHDFMGMRVFYQFLSFLSISLEAEIATIPWELSDGISSSSPSIAINKCLQMSTSSQNLGEHKDVDPSSSLSFSVKSLYDGTSYPKAFENGKIGHPWFVSCILYCCDESFLESYDLGTLLYSDDQSQKAQVTIKPMRLAIFPSDMIHTINASSIPPQVKTWRVSIVFKLMISPKNKQSHLPTLFKSLLSR